MQSRYADFYKEIVARTARLVAEWQCVGWCHGECVSAIRLVCF